VSQYTFCVPLNWLKSGIINSGEGASRVTIRLALQAGSQ
jgi:hypothetical protein